MSFTIINYFWKNLTSYYRKFFIFLFFLVLIGSLMEMLSIGIILPAFSLIFENSNSSFFFLNKENITSLKSNYSKSEIIYFV